MSQLHSTARGATLTSAVTGRSYRIEEQLRGRNANYLARATDGNIAWLDEWTVLKSNEVKTQQRFFEREREMLRLLWESGAHHVVYPTDHFTHAEHEYLALPFYESLDLDTLVTKAGPLSPRETAAIITPVADTLAEIHRIEGAHGDLKPANVLLRGQVTENSIAVTAVQLIDWGAGYHPTLGRLAKPGQFIGTLQYVPPEISKGEEHDTRSDVYGLAGLAHWSLMGLAPNPGRNVREVMQYLHSHFPLGHRDQIERQYGPHMYAILAAGLSKNPAARPGSARTFAANFAEAAERSAGFAHENP